MLLLAVFWGSVVIVLYTYVLYPLAIWLLARFRADVCCNDQPIPSSVSFILAVRDESPRLLPRVQELKAQLDDAMVEGEIVVALDGPGFSEGLVSNLNADPRIRLLQLPHNVGKAGAISFAAARAKHDMLVFADVRQRWERGALGKLLRNFTCSRVGAVSGDLVLTKQGRMTDGVGLYWRFEKWIRKNEAQYDSVIGVTGAICAVRRELFESIPAGTVLDDVYWPLKVAMRGFKISHDVEARAFDCLPATAGDEFRRKVRTLAGNFQLLQRLPTAVVCWKNRLWWQFISHKLMRLAVPWALLLTFLSCGILEGALYRFIYFTQLAIAATVVVASVNRDVRRSRIFAAVASFTLLNVAAWVAFWVWLTGNSNRSWTAATYGSGAPLEHIHTKPNLSPELSVS